MSQMNETELKQFFEDYQTLSLGDLMSKYEQPPLWNIHSDQLFQYAKDHNLFEMLVEKNPKNLYTELTRKDGKYQVQMAGGAFYDFDNLEAAVKFKLGKLVQFIFSSPKWK